MSDPGEMLIKSGVTELQKLYLGQISEVLVNEGVPYAIDARRLVRYAERAFYDIHRSYTIILLLIAAPCTTRSSFTIVFMFRVTSSVHRMKHSKARLISGDHAPSIAHTNMRTNLVGALNYDRS